MKQHTWGDETLGPLCPPVALRREVPPAPRPGAVGGPRTCGPRYKGGRGSEGWLGRGLGEACSFHVATSGTQTQVPSMGGDPDLRVHLLLRSAQGKVVALPPPGSHAGP